MGGGTLTDIRDFSIKIPVTSDFDPVKDTANRAKHGLSLAFGARVFEDADHLIIPSIRPVDGEERFKVIGAVEGRLFTAVFVWRAEKPRFISVRRSKAGEERAYHSDL
ncbi:BrnT family toxin [Tabrizicola sp. TH137]|uniref:BrnT family toxin n=1 Tax=Tabrizicola sp. TH137 TaxID=2067452 RepID=UPI0020B26A3B|nr:BrnT family toxin [Tabrizicola sp. TH137]